ncbi:FIST C-terminal domain-containing protein [Deefgea piscis]|uniref:FIST C-terminal domain-containing protein n=1 Tax=Deefgea piscis TaxID=2739061 RepID=A0A6M8SPT4_9NEIS|nr:FIST N-terminal domain-containing protein [Deefgea piscis]QKJ66731.1 FIST C-terminal domain-containing protein [Deefgea piscis]
MKVAQIKVSNIKDLEGKIANISQIDPHFLLVFASRALLTDTQWFNQLRQHFPTAALLGCSTAGEIANDGVDDDCCVITAVHWRAGIPFCAITPLAGMADSEAAGRRLADALNQHPLGGVLVLGQGADINGSALVQGLIANLTAKVPVMGGLAGDGTAFSQTLVLSNEGIASNSIVAMAIPPEIAVGHGSFGGWQPFGPARRVTRSVGNVLFELDGEQALDVYKNYLGEYAAQLPSSGLLFPFEMLGQDHQAMGVVRTILGVNEDDGSLILAGDIVADGYLRLMHASNDALIEGAEAAAHAAQMLVTPADQSLGLLVSCVGRKLVMGSRVDEEVEAVADVFGQHVTLAGFYSYGEISPFVSSTECKLHNQTMTITTLSEPQV